MNRAAWLNDFNRLFIPALKIFQDRGGLLRTSERRKKKARKMSELLNLLKEQTLRKPAGERHIKNRIVSLGDPDARPIKKGGSPAQVVVNHIYFFYLYSYQKFDCLERKNHAIFIKRKFSEPYFNNPFTFNM